MVAMTDVVLDVTTPGDCFSFPKLGDKVGIHFTGFLQDTGVQFESSRGEDDEEAAPREVEVGDPEAPAVTNEPVKS